jgi:signal transduction histidine kinase
MKSPLIQWILFSVCSAVLLGAMGWTTSYLLSMEQMQAREVLEAERDDRLRLALWRADAYVSSLLIRENSRPIEHLRAFREAEQVYKGNLPYSPDGMLLPSPLLTERPDYVKLYFTLSEGTELRSPQSPTGSQKDLALRYYNQPRELNQAMQQLEILDQNVDQIKVASENIKKPSADGNQILKQKRESADVQVEQQAAQVFTKKVQSQKNIIEAQRRAELVNRSNTYLNTSADPRLKQVFNSLKENNAQRDTDRVNEEQAEQASSEAVSDDTQAAQADMNWAEAEISPFIPSWQKITSEKDPGIELLLLRNVNLNGTSEVQGIWMDWQGLKSSILAEIEDLFPNADLEPVLDGPINGSNESRAWENQLASVPVRLHPGDTIPVPHLSLLGSTLRRSLLFAWFCFLAAVLMTGGLLYGAITLGERRGSFVSTVTHELRTPLTTFQLYTDLLMDGVTPEKQREYLETLRNESERLSHLVENVLAFAKLEKGSARRETVDLTLGEILDQVSDRLERRAGQADVTLNVSSAPPASLRQVRIDLNAIDRILYNLVDNACKYGMPEEPEARREICIESGENQGHPFIRVRDFGPGIPTREAKRLFKPFEKMTDVARPSTPGVGLGLALCERMSEESGCKLILEASSTDHPGASFRIECPST